MNTKDRKMPAGGSDNAEPFPPYKVMGEEEQEAVREVLESGILSRFLGCWHKDFNGGPEIKELETEWAEYFGVKHAITVNSATSGLYCAVGATGAGPGDEIIVSPFTMSASSVAPIIFNAVPVFADIEEDYFCLDPQSVEDCITERTKAIIVVDLFGQPYDADSINAIARKHGLLVIEDTAQAPYAKYKGSFAGTLGDIGVFSLNYHKHIHCGEGGIIVTDSDDLAEKMRLIRNHAEAVVGDKGFSSLVNMIGFNFRMTEVEAAIARCQLKKLKPLVEQRRENVAFLEKGFKDIKGIYPAPVRENSTHSYYVHALKYRESETGISRDEFVEAVRSKLPVTTLREGEGPLIAAGYVPPLYLEPIYQNLIAKGDKGCPFKCPWYKGELNYQAGLCPVCERMHDSELITHELMRPGMRESDLTIVVNAFKGLL